MTAAERPVSEGPADPVAALLTASTPHPDKVAAYLGDTYLLETVEQLGRLRIDARAFAWRHSLLLLKPDAIVARAVETTLKWLAHNNFRVVDAAIVPVNRHLVRALWYYAWNIASPERRRLADLLAGISDALLFVVTGPDGELPTPVRLTAAKGPTDPRKRRPGELRHLLGQHNFLLNLVHTPDDPADVLRELAIYFDEHRRAEVLSRAYAGVDHAESARAFADVLYARTPCRSFDRDVALERVLRDLDRAGVPAPPDLDGGSDEACAAVLTRALVSGHDIDPWSAIVLGSQVLPMRVGAEPQTLRPVTVADWREERR